MTLSKNVRNLILLASLLIPVAAAADDIDLFQGGADVTGNKPNILIIIDNSANWAAANQGWAGGIKQGESELNALVTTLGAQTSDIRVGLMMFTDGGPNGGYVRFGVRDMNAANRTALQTIMAGIRPNFNSPTEKVASAKTNYSNAMYEAYKYFSSSTRYAAHDSKRDYTGNGSFNLSPYTAGNVSGNALANASSNQYVGPLTTDLPCSKNYIIFIGNGFPSQDSSPTTVGDPNLIFTGSDISNPNYFNTTQISTSSSATNSNFADEWARFLHDKGSMGPCTGAGDTRICANTKIVTYTIDVYKDHQDIAQTALLKSMASAGGGAYCQTSSEDAIRNCLTNIFNEVQAVDSVFTSASLPVSVNTQGTYLNQIYMGVFRPDGGGKPRWMGNLKEYRFGLTTDARGNDTIYLADSTTTAGKPTAAVNNVTGFIKPTAKSYWTFSTADSIIPTAGFWAFSPKGSGGQYDAPDGDLVEKGAAAQQLRVLGPTARTVYTCPAGGCTANAAPTDFSTSNSALVTALTFPSAGISSLTRSGPTVSVTTSTDLGLASPTDTLTISGTSVADYNATWTVNKVDATHFTFTISETPATPATGNTITVAAGAGVDQSVTAANMTYSNGTVSVNLPAHGFVTGQTVTISGAGISAAMSTATNKCSGWNAATPAASTPCEYNGTFTVTKVDANNFTYTPPSTNFGSNVTTITTETPPATFITSTVGTTTSYGTATVTCKKGGTFSVPIIGMTRVSGTGTRMVTAILSSTPALNGCSSPLVIGTGNNEINPTFSISDSAAENSINNSTNGSYTLVSVGASCQPGQSLALCFNVTVATSQTPSSTTNIVPASPATGAGIRATGIPTRVVTSITRTAGNGSNVATVTLTTESAHVFSGSSIVVSGADQAEYNGTKNLTNALAFPTSTTITYTLTTGPAASSTGGSAAKGTAVAPATLINWVRGMDNKEDENLNSSLTDVRASIHGDVLHSRPVVVNYGGVVGLVAYYGSNGGVLHAVKAGDASTDGVEKWAFVAPEHYTKLARLYNNSPLIQYPSTNMGITPTPTKRDYFFDGNIGVYQSADLAATHIFVSMRRGGRAIYAFDVSNPDSPRFLWKKDYQDADTRFAELGYTWSEPKVIAIRRTAGTVCRTSDPTTFTRALVFGAGYDPTEEDKDAGVLRTPTMGRGVFVLNAETGAVIKLLQSTGADKKYSFPADVTLLDSNADGCIDRLYAVDTGANIHRFDIDDVLPANWKTYKIASLGDVENNGGSNDRKFLYPVDAVMGTVNGAPVTYLVAGSGNREIPRDQVIDNRFFMVKDTIAAGTDPSTLTGYPVVAGDLMPVTIFDGATTNIDATASSFRGWYLTLETGEKVVNAPLTVAGITYFGTNTPKQASAQCTPNLGTARGYQVSYLNGTARGDLNGDGVIDGNDVHTDFTGGGLPPSPVTGVVKIDNKFVRFMIGGGCGAEGSAIEGCKVEAFPSSTRTRVYWYFKKDN